MKKVFLGLFALVLLGAGCMPSTAVEGDWFLAFDLPNEWVTVRQYQLDSEPVPIEEGVSREISDIVLQSTSANVYSSSGYMPETEAFQALGDVNMDDFTYIRALKLDERRVIPSESEDLGDGFYRLKLCEDGDECQIAGRLNYDYYFVTEDSKYQFMVWQQGRDMDDAQDVILSAEVVTLTE
ncbi:hypothetical protein HN358_02975 [Candidatus Uhrbacteria bacterium]|jgi:hypothetical protein|nr:hypothetical protein [Candidatus Uhrbacteria bacterium]MBT7717163.1 hypothetical protein [Candidatus Uhrbacteria bacterium]